MIVDLQNIKKVYINLDRDNDRRIKFDKIMQELKYCNIERFSARLLPKIRDFNHGCSQSHHDLMSQHKHHTPLLLLEDDAKPTQWYNEYVVDGKIEIPDDADAIYLGFSTAGCWKNLGVDFWAKKINDRWIQLQHCLGTHAILFVNSGVMQQFIDNSNSTISRKIPLDIGYAKELLPNIKVYAPTKSLFYQWDKCWVTTNVVVDVDNKQWISHKEDGTVNFIRDYKNA